MKQKHKLNINIKQSVVGLIIVICLVGVAVVSIVSLQLEINDKKDELEALESEKNAISENIERLEYELGLPIDDEYIIRIVRDRLGYRLPGEKQYIYDE